ncbi:hypothetical protein ACFFKU_03875 [Kineococcus gynurae]|uniref:Uncharacterized protein n=1 Tax=Kineococcus gynurae TaxID=452979 RepID=A0ABV5LRV1_9ACTN
MAGGRWSKSYEDRYRAARRRGEPSPFAGPTTGPTTGPDGGTAVPHPARDPAGTPTGPTGPTGGAPDPGPELSAGRHCWVLGPAEDPGPFPGVLLAWRREGPTWFGRVAFVRLDGRGRPVLTDGWIPATALRP